MLLKHEDRATILPNDTRVLFVGAVVRFALALWRTMGAKMERVSYSTCSIHEEENERVVDHVLRQNPCFELG